MIIKAEAGHRIKNIRKNLNLTQEEFSALLEVSAQAVSKWETGSSLPDLEILLKISWIGNKTMNNILDGENCEISDYASRDRGYRQIEKLLICPTCKKKLKFEFNTKSKPEFKCECGAKYSIIDGVVDFGTREIPGELWSLYLKNYEHYLELHNSLGNPRYLQGTPNLTEVKWRELNIQKPRIILDIASGTGSGIKYAIQRINWPCLVIMTDLSHRILKWNNRYFSEVIRNPYIDIVYLACDCSKIPIENNSIDTVTSTGGFQSMQHKMMDGFRETFRILKHGSVSIYDMSVISDHNSDNSRKWITLTTRVFEDMRMSVPPFLDIDEWIKMSSGYGFIHNEVYRIYGELPAPDTDIFPFKNEVIQWMEEYVAVSKK